MNTIPFNDLRAQYLAHKTEIDAAIARVLESGWYILGKEVAAFEEEFAAYCDATHCVGVNSGTDALHLALRACGVGPGDEVITVAHTAVATVAAIRLTGAIPVLVDIDPTTYTMAPTALEMAITSRTRAVVPVHLYGHAADMRAIDAIVRPRGLWLIEDCAQAHGALCDGRPVGTTGDLACFSFYPTKNLGANGDGGAVVGSDPDLMERVRLLHEYGWTPAERYVSRVEGVNSRLDEVQAAILRVKLRYLDVENSARHALAAEYAAYLPPALVRPVEQPGCRHSYHLYVVRTAARGHLRTQLTASGIGTGIHYPVPIHRQPAYRSSILVLQDLSETERAAGEILSLPMHPCLRPEEVRRVAHAVTAALTT